MIRSNLKLAYRTVKATKLRSFLTMLGIIIGVVSVVTTISLGEGVKRQVEAQIKEFGSDLLIIRPGKYVEKDDNGNIIGVDVFSVFNNSTTLADSDIEAVSSSKDVASVAPLSLVSGNIEYDGEEYKSGQVIATTNTFKDLINHDIEFGQFLSDTDEGKNFAVVGSTVARQLFNDSAPIGRALTFRGQTFIVKGVFSEFDEIPLNFGANYNNAIFIPYVTGKSINEGSAQVFQILAKPTDEDKVDEVQRSIEQNLIKVNESSSDYTVLKQEDTLAIANNVLKVLTGLVATIAAISIVVGGIGVMNVMIVSVTERTREIGIRKAVGATDKQILGQFVSEAVVLSVLGGLIGLFMALLVNFAIRIFTEMQPIITVQVCVLAVLISLIVGIFFGVIPAVNASKKNPIDALRNE
ncbi:MAG TPA: ABC transporter permease [Candidatus Saccharibacteria bacterium]|nr:ABC transporter permease [Candidatus Saccharibacteria bacterium]